MKPIFILLALLTLFSCNDSEKKESKSSEKKVAPGKFDWLVGNWKRTNDENANETFENWKKNGVDNYVGLGLTMVKGDTVRQETMQFSLVNNNWELKVKEPNESEPTVFKMTLFNSDEFVCENHEIEFPNRIKYWKNGEKLNASVSSFDMAIDFEFEKVKK